MINIIAATIQIMITGGIGKPNKTPFIDAKFASHQGTTPKTVPAEKVGKETKICTPPTHIKPTPSVTIKACPCNLKLTSPLNKPTSAPKSKMTIKANHGGTPREIIDIKPTLVAPIKKGMDRSNPPNITTNVCPMVARPKKDANTSIDLILLRDKNPSKDTDPIIKSPISTETPIIILRFIFRNL